MKNSSYTAVLFTLLAMVGVAGWQFYSLTWGDSLSGRYSARASDTGLQSDATGRLTLATFRR